MSAPPEPLSLEVRGVVVPGHGVASGKGGDDRFPGGTIRMQVPHFEERGLDLREFHPATINVSIAPLRFRLVRPVHTFREVPWHPTEPAEDFSFARAALRLEQAGSPWTEGWLYHPHPETKPEHFQAPATVELLLPSRVEGIDYGVEVRIALDPEQVELTEA